ncbi:hypothetical protein [Martelella sp. HB161492]|uniref:hypothetical protein n=1 Tax=Martelella sp. HB161492 TaxID=2720726 RepID=UPI00158FD082|nr:hypothetical protein [Martelella sp. HB161492]
MILKLFRHGALQVHSALFNEVNVKGSDKTIGRRLSLMAASFAAAFAVQTPAFADEDYDLDCAVILCLAGGFPVGCADAWDYMIDRITHIPSKPPFGFCAMSDGSQYTDYSTPYKRLNGDDERGWYCPDGLMLHHEISRDDNGRRRVEAFCYKSVSYRWKGYGEDRRKVPVYSNRQAATPLDLEMQITIAPGTADEYRSSVFRINTKTGFRVEVRTNEGDLYFDGAGQD